MTVARRYLDERGRAAPPQCAIAIANPVTGDAVRMTNHDCSFSMAELKRDLGGERLVVINDFTAQALAVPALGPVDLRRVCVGGFIVPRMVDAFVASCFRERFEARGCSAGYLAQVPTFMITMAESPAFIGEARALDAADAAATFRRTSGSTP